VGGSGSVGSTPTGAAPIPPIPTPTSFPNGFPNSPQNPGFAQQSGAAPFDPNAGNINKPINNQPNQPPGGATPFGQPNLPPGGATPYGQSNPATQNAAANLINGILTNPRPGGQPGVNPAGAGQMIGAGVAGVASTAEAPAIMVYNDHTNYNEWEFIFDLSKQRRLYNPNMPVPQQNAGAPIAVGTGTPGVAVSGPATTTLVPAGTQVPIQPTYGGGQGIGGGTPPIPGQNQQPLPGMQQGGLPPGFRLGRP
jgi:hypothetical protein